MFWLFYLVSITIASQSHDNIQGQIKITDNYPTSIKEIDWGTGYNSVKLTRTYNEPVDVKMPVSAYKGFIELSYKIELCKTREEFQKFHSGGISVAASYMGVEGSADISFLTETTITSLDSVLVTSVIAITDTSRIDSAELKKEAKALLEQEQYERFVEMYGTHFLRKVLLGGKMVLVMTFSSRSTKEKNELDAKLHLTRCLRVLCDAAASQLNKHLSTNSDTCVRAHTHTADNCGVGDVPAACSAYSGCVTGTSS